MQCNKSNSKEEIHKKKKSKETTLCHNELEGKKKN